MRGCRPIAFSPDGRSIAYASDRAGNFDIWVQALDGYEPRQLTHSPSPDTQPAWSPDGTRIVFRSEREQGGLFRVSADGGPETQLTTFGVHPIWTANGTEVLFRTNSLSGIQSALLAVSPDGGEQPREVAQPFSRSGNWTWLAPHPDGLVSAIGVHLNRSRLLHLVARSPTLLPGSWGTMAGGLNSPRRRSGSSGAPMARRFTSRRCSMRFGTSGAFGWIRLLASGWRLNG